MCQQLLDGEESLQDTESNKDEWEVVEEEAETEESEFLESIMLKVSMNAKKFDLGEFNELKLGFKK